MVNCGEGKDRNEVVDRCGSVWLQGFRAVGVYLDGIRWCVVPANTRRVYASSGSLWKQKQNTRKIFQPLLYNACKSG